ncbi:hypothetical protein AVEN_91741-1 [Araneus ventricosus]|uniref:Uncharacterized protein n=1 Tax=Araneus ventricosus TaxID=182803 RepID=A0A4Y2SNX4_ARAVE|nr:hypothetical protein AVEN_91741-1 [Araneus ventricosus]
MASNFVFSPVILPQAKTVICFLRVACSDRTLYNSRVSARALINENAVMGLGCCPMEIPSMRNSVRVAFEPFVGLGISHLTIETNRYRRIVDHTLLKYGRSVSRHFDQYNRLITTNSYYSTKLKTKCAIWCKYTSK